MTNHTFRIAVIRGDGIGADVTDAAVAIIEAARRRVGGFKLDYDELLAGAGYYRETGQDIAPGAEDAAGAADAICLGAIGLPEVATRTAPRSRRICGSGEISSSMPACGRSRPIRTRRNAWPTRGPPRSTSWCCANRPRAVLFRRRAQIAARSSDDEEVRDILRITRPTTEKLHDFAFRLARKRKARGGKGRVTCVDKANVFRSMAFFRKIFDERAANFPDIETIIQLRRCTGAGSGPETVGIRRSGHGEHVRRHPLRSRRRSGRRHGHGILRRNRRRTWPVPARPRKRARHHGSGQGQSAGRDPQRGADAGLPGRPVRHAGARRRGAN